MRQSADDSPERGNAILFVSANGIGQGHLTRQLAVASRLKRRMAVFFTMSYCAAIVRDSGFPVHFVPHHGLTDEAPQAWNRHLAEEIELLIEEYSITTLVYDVNFVFDWFIDTVRKHPHLQTVWIRRGMWPNHHASYAGAGAFFRYIIEPGDYASELDAGPTAQDRARATLVPPVLLVDPMERLDRTSAREALGLPPDAPVVLVDLSRSSNPALARMHDEVVGMLIERPGVHVVELKSALTKSDVTRHGDRHHQMELYPAYRYSRAWDAAIVRASYNIFHETIAGGIPALFVPDESPDMDRQIDRARWAEMRSAALLHRAGEEAAHLQASIDRLLNCDQRNRLALACVAAAGPWRNGAVAIADLLEGALDDMMT